MPDAPSLRGPLGRIDRANEILVQLDPGLKAFIASKPYKAVLQPDDNPTNRRYIVKDIQDVPVRLRIMAGEVAHHLRASLDLLVYQLIVKEGVTDADRLRSCAFPLVLNHDLSKPDEKRKHDETVRRNIEGVSAKAYARIEALQPCRPANNGQWSHLAQIQELDNTDKHRLLLAASAGTRLQNFTFHDERKSQVIPEANVPVQDDAMVIFGSVPPRMTFNPNLVNVVIFNEPGPVFGHPIAQTLQNLSNMTRATIGSFADCF